MPFLYHLRSTATKQQAAAKPIATEDSPRKQEVALPEQSPAPADTEGRKRQAAGEPELPGNPSNGSGSQGAGGPASGGLGGHCSPGPPTPADGIVSAIAGTNITSSASSSASRDSSASSGGARSSGGNGPLAAMPASSSPASTSAPPPPAARYVGLNEEQLVAVRDRSGGLVHVSAGPGSGKTRTLVARVAELVEAHGVNPRHITVVTFTRKAADELSSRLRDMLGPQASEEVVSGTFHSLCAKMLRANFQHLDRSTDPLSRLSRLRRDFRVIEEDEQQAAVISALREAERDLGAWPSQARIRHFKEMISYVKNRTDTTHGLPPGRLASLIQALATHHPLIREWVNADRTAHQTAAAPTTTAGPGGPRGHLAAGGSGGPRGGGVSELRLFLATLECYDRALQAGGLLDYDDLIGMAVALLQQPRARREVAKNVRHILVDEFQDTNLPQYRLVQLLRTGGAEAFLVGDADQAIYTWRGALPEGSVEHMERQPLPPDPAAPQHGGPADWVLGPPPPDEGTLLDPGAAAAPSSGGAWTATEGPGGTSGGGGGLGTGGGETSAGGATVATGGAPAAAAAAVGAGAGAVGPEERPAGDGPRGVVAPQRSVVVMLRLRRNHRSLPHIVAVAERIINQEPVTTTTTTTTQQQQQHSQQPECQVSGRATTPVLEAVRPPRPGAAVTVVTTRTGRDEAAWVAEQARRVVEGSGGALGLHDVAVLFRLNRQARALEEGFLAAGVPYCLPKSDPFWAGQHVQDVAGFLRLAAAPLEATSGQIAEALTRPARGIAPGSGLLSRLRRRAQGGPTAGQLLFGDMVVTQADLPGRLLFRVQPGQQQPALEPPELLDEQPDLERDAATALTLLAPPAEKNWRVYRLGGPQQAPPPAAAVGGSGSPDGGGDGPAGGRWLPLPAQCIKRQLQFTDLGPGDKPWMLVVDNEALPAPLAPPPPMELRQRLGLQPGEAEYDGVVFLRDMVVLLNLAEHLGYEAQDLVDIVVHGTGHQEWLDLELGGTKDLTEERNQLAALRAAACDWGHPPATHGQPPAAVAATDSPAAASTTTWADVDPATSPPLLQRFAAWLGVMADAAEGAKRRKDTAAGAMPGAPGGSSTGPPDCVRLLTLHASKGLEFPVVFLTGCEAGLLPLSRAVDSRLELREAQRLLFVGCTRAMDQLYLTWATRRAGQRYRLQSREDSWAADEAAAAAAAAEVARRPNSSSSRAQQWISPFVLGLMQELAREGRLEEAAPDATGCVTGWADRQAAGNTAAGADRSAAAADTTSGGDGSGADTAAASPPAGLPSAHKPAAAPLVMYHDTTGGTYSLAKLMPPPHGGGAPAPSAIASGRAGGGPAGAAGWRAGGGRRRSGARKGTPGVGARGRTGPAKDTASRGK